MPTVTLAESAKLTQDMLAAGVIEDIITVNPFYDILPFRGIQGNAYAYNRENALGDAQYLAVGGTITAKNPATFTQVTSTLKTLVGDAEVNGLIQATRSNFTDQRITQIQSKAKVVGRTYQDTMISGTGAADDFPGILSLVDPTQVIVQDTTGVETNGGPLSFEKLDALLDLVTAKDREVDFITMNQRTIRAYYALLRALGGASIGDVITLPSGRQVPAYRGTPIFANNFIPTDQTTGTLTSGTSVIAGTLDDGSETQGLVGLTAMDSAGIQIVPIGEHQSRDESITRIKWYCGMANYSRRGLAVLSGVAN